MTVGQILKKKHAPPSLRMDLELILSFVLKNTRESLLAHPERRLSEKQLAKFNNLWKKRTQHCPLAYLTGQKEFYGFNFLVGKNVLIPRPETEYLAERVIAAAQNYKLEKLTIADVGTGSGCLAITFKKLLPAAKVIGLDTSAGALMIAKKNSRQLQAGVDFYRGDLSILAGKRITPQIIAANLPYLDKDKKQFYYKRCPELRFEPSEALFADRGGLGDYIDLLKMIMLLENKPPLLFWELGAYQIKAAKKMTEVVGGGKYDIKANDHGGTAVIELSLK